MNAQESNSTRHRSPDDTAPTVTRPSAVKDLLIALSLPALTVFAWLLPERYWNTVTQIAGGLTSRFNRATTAMLVGRIGRAMRGSDGPAPEAVAVALRAGKHQLRLQILREYRPGGWRPPTRLLGADHIDQALAQSHGGILWFGDFYSDSLATRFALSQAGYRTGHLAHPAHGPWNTTLGVRYLNPIFNRIEDRYTRQRILMPPGDELRTIWTMHQQLKANRLLSLNALAVTARTVPAPFLDGNLPLPVGPVDLAIRSTAPILPVFSVRTSSGVIEVNVGAPLAIDRSGDRQNATVSAVREFADRLAPFVLAYPEQWRGWYRYDPAP